MRLARFSLVLVAAAGCGKILGLNDYRAGTPGSGTPEASAAKIVFTDSKTCGPCVTAHCPSELDACRTDALCAAWESCIAACKPGNGACEHECFKTAGKTNRKMGEISACTLQHCLGECQSGAGFSAYAPSCGDALRSNCAGQLAACAADEPCLEAGRCTFEKNCVVWSGDPAPGVDAGRSVFRNPACAWECADRTHVYEPRNTGTDGGLSPSPLLGLLFCQFSGSPYAACALDDLSCAGRYSWEYGSGAPTMDVTVFVHANVFPEVFAAPLRNVPVRACQSPIENCSDHPDYTVPQTTGPNGDATFHLPTGGTGGYWYFEVTPGWPDGPSKLLFNPGRRLNGNTALSLAANESGLSTAKVAGPIGTTWDPLRGLIYVFNRDCVLNLVGGVELRVEGADSGVTRVSYNGSVAPTQNAPSESTFSAYISGVEPGVRTITAWKGNVKVAEDVVVVKADSVTFMNWFAPSRKPGSGQ